MAKSLPAQKLIKLHVAMYPWFAFGHFTPYLHLSNELAKRSHKVSYLLPAGAEPKLRPLNLDPSLIHFYPVSVPPMENLSPGSETASGVTIPLHKHLAAAFDQTQDQVEAFLISLKPDMVLFDFAYWLPAMASRLGIRSVYFSAVGAASHALFLVPSLKMEDIGNPPPLPGCPSLKLPPEVARRSKIFGREFGIGITFYERFYKAMSECTALSIRTSRELEGAFCDYVSEQYGKTVLLAGPLLGATPPGELDARWAVWLDKFEPASVVYCALGSQKRLEVDQFQELLLGLELAGRPFFAALQPPEGCRTVREAFPDGFEERVEGRGLVEGGWVQQTLILKHPSVGCFVTHCGLGSTWESLLSDCQIVAIPFILDQILNAAIMTQELRVAVEVERDDDGESWSWTKESVQKAIETVLDEDNEVGAALKKNHAKFKDANLGQAKQSEYISKFIQDLQDLVN